MENLNFMFMNYPNQLRLGLWRIIRQINTNIPATTTTTTSTATMNPTSTPRHIIPSGERIGKIPGDFKKRRPRMKNCSGMSPLVLTLSIGFLLLNLCVGLSEGCGPGRGAGRRRAPRKLTPLVYKQHVPNIPENVLSASGHSEGKITREDSPRFRKLVPNYNVDIIFRDDEGTGADRLMTQRCKEKLNTLAISVMNQWPGVRLRVIEGWNEESFHAPQSLHYEGRAVDITTSDKDRSKYGMLARLAVEAGFDWVYYESRAHIHCSVKSDSSQAARSGGCFSANSTVTTKDRGIQPMSSLEVGEQVLTIGSDGKPTFSPVLLFLDRNSSETREFLHMKTNRSTLTLTPSHLLYSIPSETLVRLGSLNSEEILATASIKFAREIQVGDWLLTSEPKLGLEKVLRIDWSEETGVFAPLTTSGTILVDGVLSSCYALIGSQRLAHTAFFPIRFLHDVSSGLASLWHRLRLLTTLTQGQEGQSPADLVRILSQRGQVRRRSSRAPEADEGIYWYASFLYSFTRKILPESLLYKE